MVPGSGRVPSLPLSVHNRMVELTDSSTLNGMHDLQSRIRELDKLMVDHKDPRGLFTSLYRDHRRRRRLGGAPDLRGQQVGAGPDPPLR